MKSGGRRLAGLPIAALAAIGVLTLAAAGLSPAAPRPQRHVIEIQGMAFHPAELQIDRGDTVGWINRDIVPHTATSTGKPAWDTGTLGQGASGQYVPRHKGEEPYFCKFHPVMLGKLIIR